jgi:GNAT superfamily N-acetyltransferase
VALSTLPFEKINDRVEIREEIRKYPVLLIPNLAIDKNRRKQGFGSHIIEHCIGLGAILSDIAGCRYVILYATTAVTFYSEKNKTSYKFIIAREEKDGRKLMVYRL